MNNGKKAPGPFKPLSDKGWPKWGVYGVALLSLVYLLNPTFGIFEIIPDNLPLIGNLDEGAAAIAFWYGLLELSASKKKKQEKKP